MTGEHARAMELRRLRLGELSGEEAARVKAHVDGCSKCQEVLAGFAEEQRRFEAAVPFERFEAGVTRARERQRAARPRGAWRAPAFGAIAAVALAVVVAGQLRPGATSGGGNRLKGGAGIELRIAGATGPQRIADTGAPEALRPGDRVRIGYQAGERRFVASVSVDEQGEVTPLHPQGGESLPVEAGEQTHYLPDSFEFTGRGAERVVVVLSDAPIGVDALQRAARAAYEKANGDVRHMPPLDVPGEQFARVLEKP